MNRIRSELEAHYIPRLMLVNSTVRLALQSMAIRCTVASRALDPIDTDRQPAVTANWINSLGQIRRLASILLKGSPSSTTDNSSSISLSGGNALSPQPGVCPVAENYRRVQRLARGTPPLPVSSPEGQRRAGLTMEL